MNAVIRVLAKPLLSEQLTATRATHERNSISIRTGAWLLLASRLDLALRHDHWRSSSSSRSARLTAAAAALLRSTATPLHLDGVPVHLDADAALRGGKLGRVAVDKVDERDFRSRHEHDALEFVFRDVAGCREPVSDRVFSRGGRQGRQEERGLWWARGLSVKFCSRPNGQRGKTRTISGSAGGARPLSPACFARILRATGSLLPWSAEKRQWSARPVSWLQKGERRKKTNIGP
jgi:hypothetical protein